MTIRVEAPDTAFFEPIMSPEISYNRDVRSALLQPVDTRVPYVILKLPDSRSGTFEFLLADAVAALDAENIINDSEVLTYTNDDVAAAVESFDFVVTGRIVRTRNMPYQSWLLRFGFREV